MAQFGRVGQRISGEFQANFRRISGEFQANFRRISGEFQANFRRISGEFQANFRRVSEFGEETPTFEVQVADPARFRLRIRAVFIIGAELWRVQFTPDTAHSSSGKGSGSS
jgi:hypothetical protein